MQSAREIKQLDPGLGNSDASGASGTGTAPPRLSTRQLFEACREVIIEHEGADYRLRLTSNGKLILTK